MKKKQFFLHNSSSFDLFSWVSMNKLGFLLWFLSLIYYFIHKIGLALMIVQAKALVMLLLEHVLVTLGLQGLIVLVRKNSITLYFSKFWITTQHSLINCFIIKTGPVRMIAQAKALVMLLLVYVLVTLDLLGLIARVRKKFQSMIFIHKGCLKPELARSYLKWVEIFWSSSWISL